MGTRWGRGSERSFAALSSGRAERVSGGDEGCGAVAHAHLSLRGRHCAVRLSHLSSDLGRGSQHRAQGRGYLTARRVPLARVEEHELGPYAGGVGVGAAGRADGGSGGDDALKATDSVSLLGVRRPRAAGLLLLLTTGGRCARGRRRNQTESEGVRRNHLLDEAVDALEVGADRAARPRLLEPRGHLEAAGVPPACGLEARHLPRGDQKESEGVRRNQKESEGIRRDHLPRRERRGRRAQRNPGEGTHFARENRGYAPCRARRREARACRQTCEDARGFMEGHGRPWNGRRTKTRGVWADVVHRVAACACARPRLVSSSASALRL